MNGRTEAQRKASRDGVRGGEIGKHLEGGKSQKPQQSWECLSCEVRTWGRL